MIPAVIVVLDEGFDLRLEVSGQLIVLGQDAVFEGLVPSLVFALGMSGRAADVLDLSVVEPIGKIGADVAGPVVRQQTRFVPDPHLVAA